MNLVDFNEIKQRKVLQSIGENLVEMAKSGYAEDVETTLQIIQDSYLDVLGPDDFFGTEGWEGWLNLL